MSDAANREESGCPKNSQTGIDEAAAEKCSKPGNDCLSAVKIGNGQAHGDDGSNKTERDNNNGICGMNDGSSNETQPPNTPV